jgi:hypothetical protein
MTVTPPKPSLHRHRLTKWLPFQKSNLDVVVHRCPQSEGDMDNFATEAASVIKAGVVQEDQGISEVA